MSLSDAFGSRRQSIPDIPDLGTEARRLAVKDRLVARLSLRVALARGDTVTLARHLRETPQPEEWLRLALADLLIRPGKPRSRLAALRLQFLAVEVEALYFRRFADGERNHGLRTSVAWDVVHRRKVSKRTVDEATRRFGRIARAALATRRRGTIATN